MTDDVPPMYQNDLTGRDLTIFAGVHAVRSVRPEPGEACIGIQVGTHGFGGRPVVTLWFDATCLDELVSAAHCVLREATAVEAVRNANPSAEATRRKDHS